MKFKVEDKYYDVIIQKKGNKNTYIRVKDDLKIYVTTSYFCTNKQIENLLNNNYDTIKNMLSKKCKNMEKQSKFYYLGNIYDIIIVQSLSKIEIDNNKIYIPSQKSLEKWLMNETKRIFKERLDFNYQIFEEKIPYPTLKTRTMTTRYGVCNRQNNSVTLNSILIREKIEAIDYVIVHELSHFVHFDHSKNFWETVYKYCPNYKKIRSDLKE